MASLYRSQVCVYRAWHPVIAQIGRELVEVSVLNSCHSPAVRSIWLHCHRNFLVTLNSRNFGNYDLAAEARRGKAEGVSRTAQPINSSLRGALATKQSIVATKKKAGLLRRK